jgi:hypothetical protein
MIAIVAALAIVVAALAGNAWLLRSGRGADLVTPAPRAVVQSFVGSLGANRPVQARARLTRGTRASVTPAALAALGRAWRTEYGRLRVVDGTLERVGARAVYRATLDTSARGRVEKTFGLQRDPDSRLWQIETFEGVPPGPGDQITKASPPESMRGARRASPSP